MKQIIFSIIVLTACAISVSCKKETQNTTTVIPAPPPVINKRPVVNAGPDQISTLALNSVRLDGTTFYKFITCWKGKFLIQDLYRISFPPGLYGRRTAGEKYRQVDMIIT